MAVPKPFAAPAVQGTPGGALRVAFRSEPGSLDPHKIITTTDISFRRMVFSGLTEEAISGDVQAALAESWEAPSPQTYIFKLRRGAKFHDGTEVTSDAVQASFQRAADPATGAAAAVRAIAARAAKITTPDPYTVQFDLAEPNGVFLADVGEISIVPKNFDVAKPIGTGPFQFVDWVRNQQVSFKKFDGYFRQGYPFLDTVTFRTVPDEDQKLSLLRTGQLDFVEVIPLPRVEDLQKEGKYPLVMIDDETKPSSYICRINCAKAPLDNPKVRQAINYALDREAMLDINFGFGGIKSNFVPTKHWAFNPSARSYNTRDLAMSKKLLAEAGHGSGLTIELKHHTVDATYTSLAQLIQAQLGEAGIKVNLVAMELGVWVDTVFSKKDFQLAQSGNSVRADPDAIFSDMYDQSRVNGGSIGWKNDEAQRLLGEGRTSLDREARKRIYFRLQEIIQEESPILIMNGIPFPQAATPAVQGYQSDLRNSTAFETTSLKR